MSTTGEAVRAALIADATVAGLVGGRIFPNVIPQGTVPPEVVYQVISEVPENDFTGTAADRLRGSRVQVDCYSRTYLEAHALADAVEAALTAQASQTLSVWLETSRDLYDNDASLHRVSLDFVCWR